MAYDFLKNTWSNFEKDILDKKLFLFGASQKCQKFMQRYGERLGGRIEAICDNNYTKQGQLLDSIIEKRNNGIKVWYDLNDHTGYFDTGIVELKPGDSFIDGGAYVGDTVDEALTGAEQLIKKYRPKLAICVYHKQEDLWKIPLLIKKMVPEYHIYLRHQSDYFYDTVMFAYV